MNSRQRFITILILVSSLAIFGCRLAGKLFAQAVGATPSLPATLTISPTLAFTTPPASTQGTAENQNVSPTPNGFLFQDDFSSNAQGWRTKTQTSDEGDEDSQVVDGKYRINLTAKQNYFVWLDPIPNFSAKDFLFSIDVNILDTSATPGNLLTGFTIREADGISGKRYEFSFHNDNTYLIEVWPSSDYKSVKTISSGNLGAAKLEKGINNTFSIKADKSTFTFYINGNEINSFTDTTINEAGGITLWIIMDESGQSATVEFDNLTVKEIP